MGAVESSSLDSINSLSTALDQIEQKLTNIEDIHLNHEAPISHDDNIIISSTKIRCRHGNRV